MSTAAELLGIATYSWPNGHTVVRLVGHMDSTSAHRLADEIGRLDLTRTNDVVVHMEDVTFLDHDGAAVLDSMRAVAADHGCSFSVAAPSLQVLAVLELCGVDQQLLAS